MTLDNQNAITRPGNFFLVISSGEANAEEGPSTYNCLFPAMINDWRRQWFESTRMATDPFFPFGFVQVTRPCISKYQ